MDKILLKVKKNKIKQMRIVVPNFMLLLET